MTMNPPPSKSFWAVIPGAGAAAGGAPADESLALAVALFAFVGAGMWVFQRFGRPLWLRPREGAHGHSGPCPRGVLGRPRLQGGFLRGYTQTPKPVI